MNAVDACFDESTIAPPPTRWIARYNGSRMATYAAQLSPISGGKGGQEHEDDVAIPIDPSLQSQDLCVSNDPQPPNATRPTSLQKGHAGKRSPQPQSSFALRPRAQR